MGPHRLRHAGFTAAALAVVVFLLPLSSAAGRAEGPRAAAKAAAAKRLEQRGLSKVTVRACRSTARRSYRCRWSAERRSPGELAYPCSGTARVWLRADGRIRRVTLQRCRKRPPDRLSLLSSPGPRPTFGYNEGWHVHPSGFPLLARLGGEVARQNLSWDRIEAAPGIYRWKWLDRLHLEMESVGVRPLLVLSDAPCWAQPDPLRCYGGDDQRRPTPSRYDELADFAADAVRRYPSAVGVEVWNEPNWDFFWGGEPDPQSYSAMLREVERAVHEVDPKVPVVSAGLAPFARNGPGRMAPDAFLRAAYEAGGPQVVDAIGTHLYSLEAAPDELEGAIHAQLARVVQVLSRHDDGQKPIWVTETGVTTAGPYAYGEQEQADALVGIYRLLRRLAGIPVVVFHRFYDTPTSGKLEAGYGIIRRDGVTPKPAYCALARTLNGLCAQGPRDAPSG